MEGVGLFVTAAFWSGALAKEEASVPMLDVDMLLAGDAGRAEAVNGDAEGLGGASMLPETEGWREACEGWDGIAGTAGVRVGVACGVDAAELALATEIGAGVCLWFETGYTVPSSAGPNVRAEQKPSEEVIRSVWPSLDQVRSVKVA